MHERTRSRADYSSLLAPYGVRFCSFVGAEQPRVRFCSSAYARIARFRYETCTRFVFICSLARDRTGFVFVRSFVRDPRENREHETSTRFVMCLMCPGSLCTRCAPWFVVPRPADANGLFTAAARPDRTSMDQARPQVVWDDTSTRVIELRQSCACTSLLNGRKNKRSRRMWRSGAEFQQVARQERGQCSCKAHDLGCALSRPAASCSETGTEAKRRSQYVPGGKITRTPSFHRIRAEV